MPTPVQSGGCWENAGSGIILILTMRDFLRNPRVISQNRRRAILPGRKRPPLRISQALWRCGTRVFQQIGLVCSKIGINNRCCRSESFCAGCCDFVSGFLWFSRVGISWMIKYPRLTFTVSGVLFFLCY